MTRREVEIIWSLGLVVEGIQKLLRGDVLDWALSREVVNSVIVSCIEIEGMSDDWDWVLSEVSRTVSTARRSFWDFGGRYSRRSLGGGRNL